MMNPSSMLQSIVSFFQARDDIALCALPRRHLGGARPT